ncbi:hypothetical protein NIE88_05065 [Sporolactobacillus shoreicorticis]|uniref:Resolvase/invertase-type recombinase catalytic domain-containing protein n=1 Tax=Sporolactobacillus shoreicorticis TaxID=1923877 RepID=A0ABW5RYD5_9BACL|nr:hypothetical protein [Sporolactobacillus shoreicorticis]MCO7125144.1 hypothetical protein [Sporolactobacillus shoreicorticis]
MNKNVQALRELSNLAILFDDVSCRMNGNEFTRFVNEHDRLEQANGIQLIEVKKR